ncbi:hypothetical protein IXO725_18095 [Xanthomonas oryzae pv. oryzae]|nr:hypothetical protein IXO725_18095 [Xanthomonas oryzae pv. oryzae]
MQCIALGAFESATAQPAVVFQLTDHRFHRLPSLDPAPLPARQRLGLTTMQDLHPIDFAPPIAQVHERHVRYDIDVLQQHACLLQLLGQGIAVARIAGEARRIHPHPSQAVTVMPTLTPNAYG